jgi:hypothetical protein
VRLKALKQGYLLGYQYYGCGCFIALKSVQAEMLRMKGIVYLDWDTWRELLEDEVKNWSDMELFWQYNIWKYDLLKRKYLFIKDWVNEQVNYLLSENTNRIRKRLYGSLISRLVYRKVRVYFTPFGVYVDRWVEPLLIQLLQSSKILKEVENESTGFKTAY